MNFFYSVPMTTGGVSQKNHNGQCGDNHFSLQGQEPVFEAVREPVCDVRFAVKPPPCHVSYYSLLTLEVDVLSCAEVLCERQTVEVAADLAVIERDDVEEQQQHEEQEDRGHETDLQRHKGNIRRCDGKHFTTTFSNNKKQHLELKT